MKKKKNPNSERNASIGAYLISIGVHLLLLALLGLLLSLNAGGSMRGGMNTAMASTIDISMAESSLPDVNSDNENGSSENQSEQDDVMTQTSTDNPSPDDIITKKVTPEEIKPNVIKQQGDADKKNPPSNVKNSNEGDQTAAARGRENATVGETNSTGSGGDTPLDTHGSGNSDHEGDAPGYGPFPTGSFGGLTEVPDCKKDDADNNSLQFMYDIEYGEGDPAPRLAFKSSTTAKINSGTIQQTMRIIVGSFRKDIAPAKRNLVYKGQIVCRCGSDPKCELR